MKEEEEETKKETNGGTKPKNGASTLEKLAAERWTRTKRSRLGGCESILSLSFFLFPSFSFFHSLSSFFSLFLILFSCDSPPPDVVYESVVEEGMSICSASNLWFLFNLINPLIRRAFFFTFILVPLLFFFFFVFFYTSF